MVGVFDLFNRSLDFGRYLDVSTSSVTGSVFLSLLIVVLFLLLIASFFRMPEILYLVILLPLFLIFSVADPGMRFLVGIAALFFGYVLYTILPWK
jgi:hypothetical protein